MRSCVRSEAERRTGRGPKGPSSGGDTRPMYMAGHHEEDFSTLRQQVGVLTGFDGVRRGSKEKSFFLVKDLWNKMDFSNRT